MTKSTLNGIEKNTYCVEVLLLGSKAACFTHSLHSFTLHLPRFEVRNHGKISRKSKRVSSLACWVGLAAYKSLTHSTLYSVLCLIFILFRATFNCCSRVQYVWISSSERLCLGIWVKFEYFLSLVSTTHRLIVSNLLILL